MPRLIMVIHSIEPRGDGTEEDYMRLVDVYHTTEGAFLAESDPKTKNKEESWESTNA